MRVARLVKQIAGMTDNGIYWIKGGKKPFKARIEFGKCVWAVVRVHVRPDTAAAGYALRSHLCLTLRSERWADRSWALVTTVTAVAGGTVRTGS